MTLLKIKINTFSKKKIILIFFLKKIFKDKLKVVFKKSFLFKKVFIKSTFHFNKSKKHKYLGSLKVFFLTTSLKKINTLKTVKSLKKKNLKFK